MENSNKECMVQTCIDKLELPANNMASFWENVIGKVFETSVPENSCPTTVTLVHLEVNEQTQLNVRLLLTGRS